MSGANSTSSNSTKVPVQGGLFQDLNPSVFNPADPIVLFIIQVTIVIGIARILYWPLSKINEPRVIAEVITGIILGPSVLGRAHGFTEAIFPTEGMPPFRLAANIGLVLYLFLVGMEVNLTYLVRNWRVAVGVGSLSMAIPFGFGYALAWGLYKEFGHDPSLAPINFAVFGLFIAIAIAITAFPVLCRILTSLQLLHTDVGVIVLTSGIINDVVGWILLALCVTLVNSGAGVTTVYILLCVVGYALFLAFLVRPAFLWVLRKTRSLENGPTEAVVALTIFMVFASAFFTDIIGVHPIFGAFMVGLICPHEGGFAIKLTEKIEDLISTVFVPLYFALSGLSTNLALLDSGIIWGYVVAVIVVSFTTKVIGGTLGAKLSGLVWRESVTVGTLMSCKGLVELIVLNIGLQAKILSPRTFTIFVVMALVTTFLTSPLTMWLYPPSYQRKLELWRQGKIDWDGNPLTPQDISGDGDDGKAPVSRVLVYLRTDGLSSLLTTVGLFTAGTTSDEHEAAALEQSIAGEKGAAQSTVVGEPNPEEHDRRRPLLRVHGCRLVSLSERNSSVMKVTEIEEFAGHDPIIKVFGTSAINTSKDVLVSGQIAVVPEESFGNTLANEATKQRSDLILVPWSETGTVSELPSFYSASRGDPLTNGEFSDLMTNIFDEARSVAAVGTYVDSTLLDRPESDTGVSAAPALSVRSDSHDPAAARFHSAESHQRKTICVLYTGKPDDLYAIRLAFHFAQSADVDLILASLVSRNLDSSLIAIRAQMPASLKERVTFSTVSAEDASVVPGLLNLPRPARQATIFLLGRDIGPRGDGATPWASYSGLAAALGNLGARLAVEIKRTGVANASVLVVQSKQATLDEATVPRKLSVDSRAT